MNFHKMIATENPAFRKADELKLQGIMVHSTGANNPWLRRYVAPDDGLLGKPYSKHWNKRTATKAVHAFIGKMADGTVATYQVLPFDICAWHCGYATAAYKKQSGNLTHIAFEICEDAKTDRAYMEATYREAAEFCAMLCEEYDLPVESICSHAEGYKLHIASAHSDPTHWWKKFGYSMDDFRAEVRKILEEKRG